MFSCVNYRLPEIYSECTEVYIHNKKCTIKTFALNCEIIGDWQVNYSIYFTLTTGYDLETAACG